MAIPPPELSYVIQWRRAGTDDWYDVDDHGQPVEHYLTKEEAEKVMRYLIDNDAACNARRVAAGNTPSDPIEYQLVYRYTLDEVVD